MKSVLVCAANGSEDIETVCPIDILRRAGATVTIAKVLKPDEKPSEIATLSNKIKIVRLSLGMRYYFFTRNGQSIIRFDSCSRRTRRSGTGINQKTMKDNGLLISLLKSQIASKKLVGAICAAPSLVLGTNGILKGIPATCYPIEEFAKNFDVHTHVADKVVVTDYIGDMVT